MRPSPIFKFACTGAVALAAMAVAIPSADAAVYRGRFTPDYGIPFPNLYWNGTIEVFAPDACVPASAGSVLLTSCPGMEITKATVNLYDTADKDTPLQTMDFGDAAGSLLTGLGWLLTFDSNGNLTGANSTAFPAIQANDDVEAAKYQDDPAWFSLQFLGNYAQLYWFDKEPLDPTYPFVGTVPDEVVLTAGITVPGFGTLGGVCRVYGGTEISGLVAQFVNPEHCGWSDPDGISEVGAFITFERVSEPATYALVPVALALMGVAGFSARRRHGTR